MPNIQEHLCKPCFERGRQARAARKIGETWMCNDCWLGKDAIQQSCKVCGNPLRPSNGSGYCSQCSQSGAAKRDMKKQDREFVVPRDFV